MTTFWNNDHPRYAEYREAYDRLVPAEGPAATLEGELLRAVSRIAYDFYNNGFGNNWSGALAYLDKYLGVPKPIRKDLAKFARGRTFPERRWDKPDHDGIDEKLNDLLCRVLDRITLGGVTSNPCDMYDLQEPGL